MASTVTVVKDKIRSQQVYGGVPYGNLTLLTFQMLTVAGVLQGSNKATALADADVVALCVLKAGTIIYDGFATVKVVGTALTSLDLGLEYVDGETGVPAPDVDAILDGVDLTATGKTRSDTPVGAFRLPRDAYLIATNLGADQDAALDVELNVLADVNGQP